MDQLKPEEIITQLLSGLQVELVWSLVLAGIVFYFLMVFKDFFNNVLYYFQFRSNDYVSIGKLVEVNDFVGRIKTFGLNYIIIEGEKGYYRIPMNSWQKHDWVFLRTEWKSLNPIEGKRLGLRKNDDIKIDRKSDAYKNLMENKEGATT